jgi:hypothetical protein
MSSSGGGGTDAGSTEPEPLSESVTDAVFASFDASFAELREGIESGILVALGQAVDRHGAAIKASGLDRPPSGDTAERAEQVQAYRHEVTGVLDALALQFGARGPASSITSRLTSAMHATVEATKALPVESPVEWAPNAMARRTADRGRRRVAKALARAFGVGRKVGQVRPVPVQAVARRSLQAVLLPLVDEVGQEAGLAWARWGQEFERAWVAWAEAILALLIRATKTDEAEPDAVWQQAATAADQLHLELERLTSTVPQELSPDVIAGSLEAARECLDADLAVAGSFVYSPGSERAGDWELPKIERIRPNLATLDEGVATRLSLYSAMLGMIAGASAVRGRLLSRFEDECLTRIRTLRAAADTLETLLGEVPSGGDPPTLRARLEAFRDRVAVVREPVMTVLPEEEIVTEILDGGAKSMAEALSAMVRQAPEELLLTDPEVAVHARRRKVETRAVPMRQLARQSFDVLRIERIRLSTKGLEEGVERLRRNLDELQNVSRFAFDSALQALDREGEQEAMEHAPQLVGDAIKNIADSLRQEVSEVEQMYLATGDLLDAEVADGALGLIDRVVAEGVQAKMLAAQSRLTEVWAWTSERWGPRATRGVRWLRHYGKVGRRLWRKAYRASSRIFAGATGEDVASARSMRLLADARTMMRELPPVYQRLFTLESLSGPTLLVGRDQELADIVARWKRFETGDAGCVVLRGRPGCGISSFLSAVERQVTEEGATTATVRPEARVTDEREWVAQLASALGLPAAESLVELAGQIRTAESGALPRLVTVDNLEHLFLRVPGGVDLVDRTLSFMTETETHVLWIGAMTSSAWQQVAVTIPNAIAQMDGTELAPLEPLAMRSAIVLRHRRSGLTLQYSEPKDSRRLLKRKLRRATTPEAVRSVLADDFFDQLSKTSSGHLRLALFQWLQSCDFSQDSLVIRPPVRPDFSSLDSLTLTQAFTLKAFLEHRTLTLAEHDEIFRISRSQSTQIMESLMNRRLLTAVGEDFPEETLERDAERRYRIHHLLVGAVVSHLRGRNIVH